MDAKFYTIILNPYAGSGHAQKIWPTLKESLDNNHINYQLNLSKYPGHAIAIAKEFAEKTEMDNPTKILLIIGGDGTLHQAINGLQQAKRNDIPVAYLPCGSGNDFARAIGLSRNPETALQQLQDQAALQVYDIGFYHEHLKNEFGYFINNLGIGFDAFVVSTTNSAKRKKWLNKLHLGSLAYIFSLIEVFAKQDDFQLTVATNEQRDFYPHAFLVTTTNHPFFGGGVPIMPLAKMNDQKLDLVVVEKLNPFLFIWLFIKMLRGKHLNAPQLHHYQLDKLHLKTTKIEFGQADGEELGNRCFDIDFSLSQQSFWLPQKRTTSN